MAANIEFNSNRNTYSFYSLKELPWHGLGTIVEEANLLRRVILSNSVRQPLIN